MSSKIEEKFEEKIKEKHYHYVFRLDGKKFSTFAGKGFVKGFDFVIAEAMAYAGEDVRRTFKSYVAYTVSDETSLLLTSSNKLSNDQLQTLSNQMAFYYSSRFYVHLDRCFDETQDKIKKWEKEGKKGTKINNFQKLVIANWINSKVKIKELKKHKLNKNKLPRFDCRVIICENLKEAVSKFILSRVLSGFKNSQSVVAQHYFNQGFMDKMNGYEQRKCVISLKEIIENNPQIKINEIETKIKEKMGKQGFKGKILKPIVNKIHLGKDAVPIIIWANYPGWYTYGIFTKDNKFTTFLPEDVKDHVKFIKSCNNTKSWYKLSDIGNEPIILGESKLKMSTKEKKELEVFTGIREKEFRTTFEQKQVTIKYKFDSKIDFSQIIQILEKNYSKVKRIYHSKNELFIDFDFEKGYNYNGRVVKFTSILSGFLGVVIQCLFKLDSEIVCTVLYDNNPNSSDTVYEKNTVKHIVFDKNMKKANNRKRWRKRIKNNENNKGLEEHKINKLIDEKQKQEQEEINKNPFNVRVIEKQTEFQEVSSRKESKINHNYEQIVENVITLIKEKKTQTLKDISVNGKGFGKVKLNHEAIGAIKN